MLQVHLTGQKIGFGVQMGASGTGCSIGVDSRGGCTIQN